MGNINNGKVNGSLKRKRYERSLADCKPSFASFRRVVVLFEGRDTAGKGGTIRAMTERVSPPVFRTGPAKSKTPCR